MKIDSLFPKKYLQAADLKGRAYQLTIDRIEMRAMRTKETNQVTGEVKFIMANKPVVYFRGRPSGVVLNKTRAGQLAEALGIEDTDQAHGQPIVIFADGNQIMFRAAAPKPDAKPAEGSGDVSSE